MKKVKCSKCVRQLEPIGSMLDSFQGGVTSGGATKAALKQWSGWVCMRCKMVFCWQCAPPRGSTPSCPNCGQRLNGAMAMFLKQIGK